MAFRLRGLLAAGALVSLAACGGGGGGGDEGGRGGSGSTPPAPTLNFVGASTPANLSSSTATPEVAAWLLIELGLVEGLSPGSIAIASAQPAAVVSLQKRLNRTEQMARSYGKATAQTVTTEACSGGGTTEINDNGLRDDGTGVVILTFRGCIEDGARLDGVIRTTVAVYNFGIQEPADYTMSFEGLTLSAGSSSIEAGGSLRVVFEQMPGINVTTSTYNTVTRYSPENVYTRLENFVEVERVRPLQPAEPIELTFSGRFYQSAHGYVNVDTTTTLLMSPTQAYSAGQLRLRSASNALALLRFDEDRSTVSVGIDIDGDGTVERGLSGTPRQWLGSTQNYPPFANAGSDVSIDEGQSVTLDGSLSRDWENGPLTYSWTVVTVPLGSAPVAPGSGPTFSFTPPEGGEYVVQLTVSDGQLVGHDRVHVNVRDNAAPTAEAGYDRTVLERESATLDASASYDHEGDALQFTWRLIQAPAGSAAPASLSGVTAQLTTDLPGAYVYELQVADVAGSDTDYITVYAEAVLTRPLLPEFWISSSTTLQDTTRQVQLQVNPRYTGPPLPLTITSNVPWLRVDTPNVTTASQNISLSLDLPRLGTLPNGNSEALLRITPANNFAPLQENVRLFMHLPILEQVTPYVVYAGQPTGVALYGYGMDGAHGQALDVSGTAVSGFTDLMLVSGRITLPALAAGEYEVRVRNQLGIQFPPTRLVVRDPPNYPDEELPLPGAVRALEYDAERDVFYAVFSTNTGNVAQRLVRQQNGSWQFDSINVPNPRALTLTADGTQLLVTSANCGVHELDVATLQVIESAFKGNCVSEDFGIIHGLANGRVLIGDSDQWSSTWTYPGFETTPYLPSIHSATTVLSYDRTLMIWAEQPSISPPREIYAFDTYMRGNASGVSPNDTSTNFTRSNLASSGDGMFAMHREDVYENIYHDRLSYVGSLPVISGANLMPALSRYGTRAVVLDPDTDTLSLFDVAGLTLIQDIDTFTSDVLGGQLMFLPDDSTVFSFTQTSGGNRLFVRGLP